GREIAISALREWMAQLGQHKSIAVAFIGKVKTVAQMTAIIALLLWEDVIPGVSTPFVGTFALWVAAILTLWSMFHYLKLAAPHIGGATLPLDPDASVGVSPTVTPAAGSAPLPSTKDSGGPMRRAVAS